MAGHHALPYRRGPHNTRGRSRGATPNANEGRRQKGLAPRVEKLKQSDPNPPAHNAYATTPQPANPVRHAAIHSSMIPQPDDLRARRPNAVRICIGVNGSAINRRPEITKIRWEK